MNDGTITAILFDEKTRKNIKILSDYLSDKDATDYSCEVFNAAKSLGFSFPDGMEINQTEWQKSACLNVRMIQNFHIKAHPNMYIVTS